MSDFDLIIRAGSVVRPDGVNKQDIGIKEGHITALGPAVYGSTDADLDATDFHIFPGLIDPHVHLHEPGRAEWEGFDAGSRALAAGGVTCFFDAPENAAPPPLDRGTFLAKLNFARANSLLDFGLWAGMTSDNLDQLEDMTNCGAIGLKAYMCASGAEDFPAIDDGALFEGMQRAFDLEQIVAVHAENESITARLARRAVAEGRLSARDYLESRPVIAELEAIQRAIFFAWETDCSLHVAQVSTARGAELIAGAREQGLNISCETSPHYLILTAEDAERLGVLGKCQPPLRPAGEVAALWEQLSAGQIDMIASDHSPASPEAKKRGDLFAAAAGLAGGQSTLGLMLTAALGKEHPMPLGRLSELLATNAARRFRLHPQKGEICVGADADLLIVDLDADYVVKEEQLLSRYPAHSPYLGRKMSGRILRTILRGQTICREGRIVGKSIAQQLRPAENEELLVEV